MKKILLTCFVLAATIYSCNKDETEVDTNAICDTPGNAGWCFSIPDFAENLEQYLGETTTGFSYSIYKEDEMKAFGSEGVSVTQQDGGPYNINASITAMNVGSTAKSLTTIATLQLLEQNGLTPRDYIKDYLPQWWTFGDDIDAIKFEDLLTHKSGFRPSNDAVSYNQIKQEVENGIDLSSDYGVANYQNINFCILRIIIPILNGDMNKNSPLIDVVANQLTIQSYMNYIKSDVVAAAGFGTDNISCDNDQGIRYYNYYNPNDTGWLTGNECQNAGGGTLSMPSVILGGIMARAYYTNDLLSPAMKLFMFNPTLPLGCYDNQTDATNTWGWQFHHNGGFINNENIEVGKGGQACWYVFHNEITVAVSTNSYGGIEGDNRFQDINDLIEVAYDGAWYQN